MCEMCERAGVDDDREYQPVRLRCKTTTLAEAFRVIVTEMRGGMKTEDGSVMQPYADGDTVVMPWAGHPKFVDAITALATATQVAEPEAIREMAYGAMAQGMSTAVENVRNFGETIARAMMDFMRTVGSQKPIDVDGIMSTLDADVQMLQERERGDR